MGPDSGKSKRKGLTFAADTKAASKHQHPSCFGSTDNLSNKSRKRNSSDSPSSSATNEHGCDVTMTRLRSVLCHPLGLPLLYAFDGKNPSELQCLAKMRGKTPPEAKQDDATTYVAEIEAEEVSVNDDDEEVEGDKKKPAAEENTDNNNEKELAAKDSKGGKGKSPVKEKEDEEMEYAAAPSGSRQDVDSIEIATGKVLLDSVMEWRKHGTGENRTMTRAELQDQLRSAGQIASGKLADLKTRCEKHGLPTTTTEGKPEEDGLTRLVAKKITQLHGSSLGYYAHSEVRLKETEKDNKSQPLIDVLLSPAPKQSGNGFKSTPFAAIEFGLNGGDWSKKLDQNVKYRDMMVSGVAADTLKFEDPILCGVVTIEDEPKQNRFQMKTGVFLCSRRDLEDKSDEFRMSLLWHTIDSDLDSASKSFGLLLRITNDFSSWVKEDWPDGYEYLSSSCCRCKYQETDEVVVLRSYDSRVRASTRNPAIYLDQECQDTVGIGTTRTVFEKLSDEEEELDEPVDDRNPLEAWLWRQKGGVKIICTPYRFGVHVAKSPAAFVPIIRQLQRLHSLGYVHGDIRAFNVVFGNERNEGWLIDFDYGGSKGTAFYPQGYNDSLSDGSRLGQELHEIKCSEDWFALGALIFDIHVFQDDTNDVTRVAAEDPKLIVFDDMNAEVFQKAVDAAEPGDIQATAELMNEILRDGDNRLREFTVKINGDKNMAKFVLESRLGILGGALKAKQVEKELKEDKMQKTWRNGEERSDDDINELVKFLEEVQHTKYGPSVKFQQCLDRMSNYAAVNAATTKATKTVHMVATGAPIKKHKSKAAAAPAPAPS